MTEDEIKILAAAIEKLPRYVPNRAGGLTEIHAWPDSSEVVVKLDDVLALLADIKEQNDTKQTKE